MMATIETLFVMDEETQIKGLSYIFYCKGLTLAHTTLFSPIDMGRCSNNIFFSLEQQKSPTSVINFKLDKLDILLIQLKQECSLDAIITYRLGIEQCLSYQCRMEWEA